MKIFYFLFIYLVQKIICDYETLNLSLQNSYYYIEINFPNPNSKTSYIFSTNLPKCFFPSTACSVCRDPIIDYSNEIYENYTKNISIPYYFYNFTGREYDGTIYTDKYFTPLNFCSFDNLSYSKNYTGKGRFSLSFLNYNFNTEKQIFAIKFKEDESAELQLGGYDNNVDFNQANNYKVTVEYIYENYTEEIEHENISINYNNYFLNDNNFLAELNDNDSYIENITIEVDKSKWYINFADLKIKTESESDVDYPMDSYKLTLDMSTNKFYIPRNFFVKNVKKFFPEDAKCQLTRDGYFVCQCDEDYKTKFGSFVFITEEGTKFYVNVTDYMSYKSSITGSQCEVHLVMNYDNDLFIGGTTVLNNYYSIFDIDESTLIILPREGLNERQTVKYIILFIAILLISALILFGGYFLYNKYIINESTGLMQPNFNQYNNNNQQN